MQDAAPALFRPLQLKGLELPNRIVVSPMDQYRSVDGSLSDWHLMHLGQFAKSGVGLVMTEAMNVEPEARITTGCAGLYNDANQAALKRILDFCRENGSAKLGVQITHAGRKGSARLPWEARNQPLAPHAGGWQTFGCSGQAYGEGWPGGKPLAQVDRERIRAAHARAASRANEAGADLLEVVMAHGYLLHEFLSPISNTREDDYGGRFENRLRYPLEVFEAVRAAWPPNKPLGVRISAMDHLADGWDLEQSIALCRELEARGCDFVCVSSGGLSLAQKVPIGEAHQVPYATAVGEATGLSTMTVGMIQDPHQANRIVEDGGADLIALARAFLSDPHWAWYAAATLDAEIEYPPEYIRGYRSRWLRQRRAGRTAQDDTRIATPHGRTR